MISLIGISSTLLSPFISRCIWYVYLSGHLYIIIYWYICFLSINMCINNPGRNNSCVSLQSCLCCKEKYGLSSRLNFLRSDSPLGSQGHKRSYEPIHHDQKENLFRRDEYFIGGRDTYPKAPRTPSLRFTYPRFVAGIQTSNKSRMNWYLTDERSLYTLFRLGILRLQAK